MLKICIFRVRSFLDLIKHFNDTFPIIFQIADLAKTGDSEKKQLLVEWTLEMRNEAAHGIILDINQ